MDLLCLKNVICVICLLLDFSTKYALQIKGLVCRTFDCPCTMSNTPIV